MLFMPAMESKIVPYSKMLAFLKEHDTENADQHLSNIKVNDLLRHLHHLMEAQKPFLESNYSLFLLAHDLSIAPYQLSAFINKILRQRFNDLINYYRISYCLELMSKSPKDHTKVQELSALCGYNNRNTFISAFKKFTNRTPSTYIRQLKKQVIEG